MICKYIHEGVFIGPAWNRPPGDEYKVGDFITDAQYANGCVFRIERIEYIGEIMELHLIKIPSIEN
jgi:hypothetical protein